MTPTYEIGPFRLDPKAQVLAHGDIPVPLGPRAIAVLAKLVEHAHEYVTKAQIFDAAWPGVVVEESNLASQISAVRRALTRAPGGEHWIETLARRGYRFVGPVVEVAGVSEQSASSGPTRTNLPHVLGTFVGRKRELVEIRQLLSQARMLTLTGPGGIGKTRLALEIAAEMLDDYANAVWFVDLAPIVESALVPKAIAQALGVMEVASEPLTDTLCSYMRPMRCLLILDNCEHLVGACAGLVEPMLGAAPSLRILATSREGLHVFGEQCYQLSSLSLPADNWDLDALSRSEAVQLFVERGRLQRPGFALTSRRAPAIAELCVRLDGMPLALELAAARVAVLPVEKIVDRLNNRFQLLTGGSRTALPRQQTLHATITWSFELLSEAARTLLTRLSMFAGGFNLEAAEAVAADDRLLQEDVLDLLSSLVNKSLVVVENNGERYRLLETIREYARERLRVAGEDSAVRERHFDWYLRLAERLEPSLLGGAQQKPALDLLEADHDNLRAALAWSLETPGRGDLALRMCGTLYRFWSRRGHWHEGYEWCMKALAPAPRTGDSAARGKVLLTAGSLGNNVHEAETRILLEDALTLSREAGDRNTEAITLNNLARVLDWHAELSRVRSLLEQARKINRELGNKTLELHNMANLVNVLRKQQELAAALALAEEGLTTSRSSGDLWPQSIFLYLLGRLALDRGNIAVSQRLNEQALELSREMVMPDWQSFSLVKLAFLAVVRSDPASARCHLAEAVDISSKIRRPAKPCGVRRRDGGARLTYRAVRSGCATLGCGGGAARVPVLERYPGSRAHGALSCEMSGGAR